MKSLHKIIKESINSIPNNKSTSKTTSNNMEKENKQEIMYKPDVAGAVMEALLKDKKSFNNLYKILANEGFVPVVENNDYNIKRKNVKDILNEGKFNTDMLQSLFEHGHIQKKEKISEASDRFMTLADLEKQNKSVMDKQNQPAPNVSQSMAQEPFDDSDLDADNDEFADSYDNASVSTDLEDAEEENIEGMADDSSFVPDEGIEDEAILNTSVIQQQIDNIKGLLKSNMLMMKSLSNKQGFSSVREFADFVQNQVKPVMGTEAEMSLGPDEQQAINDFMAIYDQNKGLTKQMNDLEAMKAPKINIDDEPLEMDESKHQQLRGTGKSELQLRAGAKGRVFESLIKKLEPYKKIALLEFLENDPKMLDDNDYREMSVLTGINEGDIIAMRIAYENEGLIGLNEVTYPVFGGQDVRKENEKNEKTQLDRDVKQANKSQETTDEKVYDFKVKKFSLLDTKDKVEQNGMVDQNRGMHTQVDVLNNETNNSQKDRYEDEANGVFGKRDPESVKNDANVGDGKVYGSEGTTEVGEELLEKGAEQPSYYAMTPNEGEKAFTDKSRVESKLDKYSQPIKVKNVNEDIQRMKGLYGYETHDYIKPRGNDKFNSQLDKMRVLKESVDMSDMPTTEDLMEMDECEYNGKKAKTDGVSYFDYNGQKLGECSPMEEARNNQLKAGLAINPHQLEAGTNLDEAKKKNIKQTDPRVDKSEPEKESGKVNIKTNDGSFTLNYGKRKFNEQFDISNIDEGTDTGKVCRECGHKIWEVNGDEKCACKNGPKAQKDDVFEAEKDRMKKLSGVKTESKHQQLKHSKGNQLKAGAKEELVDESKHQQLKHSKGNQLKAGAKKDESEQ